MPNLDDFHAFKSTSDGNGVGSGLFESIGCLGWIIIIIVVIMLFSFISNGASWVAIDRLLGFGLLLFLAVKYLSS